MATKTVSRRSEGRNDDMGRSRSEPQRVVDMIFTSAYPGGGVVRGLCSTVRWPAPCNTAAVFIVGFVLEDIWRTLELLEGGGSETGLGLVLALDMEAGSGDPPRRKSDRRNRDKKRDSVSADSRGIYISFSIDLSIPFLDRSHSIYFDGHFSRLFFADPATTADFHPQTRRKEGKKEERKSENDSTREREIGHLLSLVFTCDT
ncbi:hypothetical protein FRC16_001797 [Serendipita sp. 398]|nr:hypothetical protein FRC16_001797 [Serendipita sp. 398]